MLGKGMVLGKGVVGPAAAWPLAAIALQWVMTAATAFGQGPTTSEDKTVVALSARMGAFFESVSESVSTAQLQGAYDKLLVGSPLKQEEQIAGLLRKTAEIPKTFGAYRKFEQVMVKRVGKDLVLMRYLYKCENFPVVWNVAYYRDLRESRLGEANGSVENWRVISIRFDSDLDALTR